MCGCRCMCGLCVWCGVVCVYNFLSLNVKRFKFETENKCLGVVSRTGSANITNFKHWKLRNFFRSKAQSDLHRESSRPVEGGPPERTSRGHKKKKTQTKITHTNTHTHTYKTNEKKQRKQKHTTKLKKKNANKCTSWWKDPGTTDSFVGKGAAPKKHENTNNTHVFCWKRKHTKKSHKTWCVFDLDSERMDLRNAWYPGSSLLSAMVLCTALPCLITCATHMTVTPDRDFRVPKSRAWTASQNTSRTPSKVCGSNTIAPPDRHLK